MNLTVATCSKILCCATGAVLGGPGGAYIGKLAGALLSTVLPVDAVVASTISIFSGTIVEKVIGSLNEGGNSTEQQRINHDLQTAFRDSFREALYDVGGPRGFPQAWAARSVRDVPPSVIYFSTAEGERLWAQQSPLAAQACQCLQDLERALDEQRLLPFDPPLSQPAASVLPYLEADTPQDLTSAFFEQVIDPFLAGRGPFLSELPGFERHLRNHLLDRTMIHLAEALKHRDPAWRAFNRLLLEELRETVRELQTGQTNITSRLDELLARCNADSMAGWSHDVAELLAATGQTSKQIGEGFDAVLKRAAEQHADVLAHLRSLWEISSEISRKLDRVLFRLESGGFDIIGAPPVPVDTPAEPGQAPFMGLQGFGEADAHLFFGRQALTARLVRCLCDYPFLAVVGASGSGKSSVVHAGLAPALASREPLADGALPPRGSAAWPVRSLVPTSHPLDSLAASLTSDAGSTDAAHALRDELSRDPGALLGAARRVAEQAGGARILLVVDQFEEAFTLCDDEAERAAFIAALLASASQDTGGPGTVCPLAVVVVLRADFYEPCARYEGLRLALAQHQWLIGPMSAAEMRSAIEEPAHRGGWEFERGLVDLILHDVGDEPGALPLLSHALLETWQRRRGRIMTLESYFESGGVRGAIARTAETVFYKELRPEQQIIARGIFLRLTQLGEGTQDTRRRASLGELTSEPDRAASVSTVLKILAGARLITVGQGTVEVAHEALIREWPALRQWLDENRAWLRVHHRLAEAALEWDHTQRDEGLLYRGSRLAEAREWCAGHRADMNAIESAFLDCSIQASEREAAEREAQRQRELAAAQRLAESERSAAARLRRRALWLTAAALVAVALAVVAGLALNSATSANRQSIAAAATAQASANARATAEAIALEQRNTAEQQAQTALSRQLAAQAVGPAADQADLALLLAATAHRISDTLESRSSLLSTLEASARIAGFLRGHQDKITGLAFSPDGGLLASAARDGVILWDTSDTANASLVTHDPVGEPWLGQLDGVWSLAYSPDGKYIAAGGRDGSIMLWNVTTRKPACPATAGPARYVNTLAFSPDGRMLAAGTADGAIRLWDTSAAPCVGAATLRQIGRPLAHHTDEVYGLAFSPDGETLASASLDGTAILWDMGGVSTGSDTAGEPAWQPLIGHRDGVLSVAFSPDGRVLATGSRDNTVLLWDVRSRQPLGPPLTGHTNSVTGLAFSPDGRLLVSGSSDRSLRLWDVATRQPVGEPLVGHTASVGTVAFSPDGRFVASGGEDATIVLWNVEPSTRLVRPLRRAGTPPVFTIARSPDDKWIAAGTVDGRLLLWDAASLQLTTAGLVGHTDAIERVIFSPDGKTLATAGRDENVVLWGMDGQPFQKRRLQGHAGKVRSLAISPDGRLLASAGDDNVIVLWDTATEQEDGAPMRTGESVYSLAFSPDGSRLASGSFNGTIALWDVASRRPIGQPLKRHTSVVWSLAFSPDGRSLVSGSSDNKIGLWNVAALMSAGSDATAGQMIDGHEGRVYSVAFSPDGRQFVSGSGDKSVRLWDAVQGTPITGTVPARGESVTDVAYMGDGRVLWSTGAGTAGLWDPNRGGVTYLPMPERRDVLRSVAYSADGQMLAAGGDDDQITLWNAAGDGAPLGTLVGHTDRVESVAFSPQNGVLASGSRDGSVRLWDARSLAAIGDPMKVHTDTVMTVAFSPDGKLLASGGYDRKIILWDTASRQPVGQPLVGHLGTIYALAFSPDGHTLASVGDDESIRLWDSATGQPLGPPLYDRNLGTLYAVAFSPDGKLLAVGSIDPAIALWDVATRKRIGQLMTGHGKYVDAVVFSPDGRTLATGSGDGSIILWDVASQQMIGRPLVEHTGDVNALAFSRDGKTLASAGSDGAVLLWSVGSETWPADACDLAGRNLSPEEWDRYLPGRRYDLACPENADVHRFAPSQVFTTIRSLIRLGDRDRAADAYRALMGWVLDSGNPLMNNRVCWFGSLDGFAETVLPACGQSLRLLPDNAVGAATRPGFQDSRGLARAMAGDTAGAIEDFLVYAEWAGKQGGSGEGESALRRQWIAELKAGRNPFDAQVLQTLRGD